MTDEQRIEVVDGAFAGFPAVLARRVGNRVQVKVEVFGRWTPVDLHADQVRVDGLPLAGGSPGALHAALREEIAAGFERLAETEALAAFRDRAGTPEADPTGPADLAAEWDDYVARSAAAQPVAEQRQRAALERFDQEVAPLPIAEARRTVAADAAYWRPAEATVDGAKALELAAARKERARLAAAERDYERWAADRPAGAPSRGNPGRYAYARAPRLEVSRPEDGGVELAIRSRAGVGAGPVPRAALDAVDGLRLELGRPADLAPLGRLRHLRWLSVRSAVPLDLAALAAALAPARALRDLSIEAPIAGVGPLARLDQVENLRLDHTRVTDLTPLAELIGLRDLSVCDGPLADLAPLAGLTLRRLFVHRTRVRDLAPLSGMATLQVLGLAGCPVDDLSVVTTLPSLHFVNLRGTGVTDLGDLPERRPRVTFEGAEAPPVPTPPGPALLAADGDLLTEFRAAEDDYVRAGRLQRAMLAARRVDLVQELIGADLDTEGSTVAGLLLPGGSGDAPFSANPWGVPPGAGLAEALDRVWAPVAGLAPRFVAAVHDRTLGLALLAGADGRPALAYLTWSRDDPGSGRLPEPPAGLDDFGDPARDLHLRIVLGTAPHTADPAAVVPVLAGPVPRPVRDLWSVHHGLRAHAGIGGALAQNTLQLFGDDPWTAVALRLGGLPPDRFVHSVAHDNADDYVLDLDLLDAGGNPTVARWAFQEWTVGEHRQYWDWFDSTATDLLFGP